MSDTLTSTVDENSLLQNSALKLRHFRIILYCMLVSTVGIALAAYAIDSSIRVGFIAGALLSLISLLLTRLRKVQAALYCFTAGFALVVPYVVFWGNSRAYGVNLCFVPLFLVFVLYFGSYRGLRAAMLWSLGIMVAWLFPWQFKLLDLTQSLSPFLSVLILMLLIIFIENDLTLFRLDTGPLVREMQHRVNNLLQIAQGLRSMDSETENGGRLQGQLDCLFMAFSLDQENRSLLDFDLRTLLCGLEDYYRKQHPDCRIELRGSGKLDHEYLVPLSLFLKEWLDSSELDAVSVVRLQLGVKGRTCALQLSAAPRVQNEVMFRLGQETIVGMLSRQLRMRMAGMPDESTLALEFDLLEGNSDLSPFPEIRHYKTQDQLRWKFARLFRIKSDGESNFAWRKLVSLNIILLFSIVVLFAAILITYMLDRQIRVSALFWIMALIPAWFLSAHNRQKMAASVYVLSAVAAEILAFANSPGIEYMVPAIAFLMPVLFSMHFIGKKTGMILVAWNILAMFLWYFFSPTRLLPLAPFLTQLLAMTLFAIFSLLFFSRAGEELNAKEALAWALKVQPGRDLALMQAALSCSVNSASHEDLFDTITSLISASHAIINKVENASEVQLADALKQLSEHLQLGQNRRLPVEKIQVRGSLQIGQALPCLLLAALLLQSMSELDDKDEQATQEDLRSLDLQTRNGRTRLEACGLNADRLNEAGFLIRRLERQLDPASRPQDSGPELYLFSF
ncbi:MAG: hypothetical protein KKI09_12110 [Spirochaetes bacterium]|nr:hypothetical protein [Spirochaetota bacterium]